MHIAAYMAALDIDDLDHMAKVAVQTIAGRANQHTATATVRVRRIATDLHVNYTTAHRALTRAVKAGYLTVDNSPGQPSSWHLTSRLVHELGSDLSTATYGAVHEGLVNRSRRKDNWIKTKESDDAQLHRVGDAAPVEKPGHPATCQCQGSGIMELDNSDTYVTCPGPDPRAVADLLERYRSMQRHPTTWTGR